MTKGLTEEAERGFLETLGRYEQLINKVTRIYALDSEGRRDLFQEIVYQLWPSYGSFKGESHISTWLYRVALNTARLYLFAYVASIAFSLALIEILLIRGKGWSLPPIIFAPIGVAFIVWSYLSGRRYASRMFRSYRSDLVNTLNELDCV
jgi:hypothetical protein